VKQTEPLRRAGTLGALGLCSTLLLLAVARAYLAERIYGSYTLCTGCFFWPSLSHDGWLLALLLALTAITFAIRSYALQLIFTLASVVLVLVIAIDVGLLHSLSQRLYWPELRRYVHEPAAVWAVWRDAFKTDHGAMLLVLTIITSTTLVLALFPRRQARGHALGLGGGALALLAGLSLLSTPIDYVHPESVQNILELNRGSVSYDPYSPAFIDQLSQRLQPLPEQCETGLGLKPNLILMVVESLSSYQSKLLGGPMDYTPELDRIAIENTWFSGFVANGYSTDMGLIALLNGRLSTQNAGAVRAGAAFRGFDEPRGSTVALVEQAGYETHFFGAFDLNYIDTRTWLERVGFDSMEGVEQPIYDGLPRFQFDSAQDSALFDRILQWIDKRPAGRPFFATALTMSSHPPFVNPTTDHADEGETLRYVDHELARFEQALVQRGFFNDGILLITGDHRSMTPLHRAERERFGDRAFARIPMIVVGGPLRQGVIDGRYQQSDLKPSIDYLTGTRVCRHAGQAAFLRSDPQQALYTLHLRGDEQGRIDVDFDGGIGTYYLAGDESRSIGPTPPNWPQISDWIHADRISRSEGGDAIRQRILTLDGQQR
jgi:lipoteichoic acid synthase